jgi:glucose/arabinose dehydrogenase
VTAALAGVACLLLAGCAFGPPPPDQEGEGPNLPHPSASPTPTDETTPGTADVVAKHLSAPWGIAFLPDNTALVTERATGRILHVGLPITPGGMTLTTVGTVAGVDPTGDGGLLGIAVSPRYANDSTVFVYYSTTRDNRIGSIKVSVPAAPSSPTAPSAPASPLPSGPASPGSAPPLPPGPTLTPHPILTGIPHAATDNGGWLAFGPDGTLYASTGDAGRPASAQDRKSLAGKILRMTDTGRPAPHNPVATSVIWAYGFHDVEGFDWDIANYLYAVDAARTGTDVLDNVVKGGNYGWPISAKPDAEGTSPSVREPLLTWPLPTSGCAGVAVLNNLLAAGCLTGKRIWLVQLTDRGGTFGAPVPTLTGVYGRLRAVVRAPDGSLWVTSSNTDGHGKPGRDDDVIIRVVLADAGAGKS